MKSPLVLLSALLYLLVTSCRTVYPFHPNIANGGRIVAVTSHPQNDQSIIAAAETGGIFKTTNGGKDWSHIDNFKPYRMSDVAYSPTNPNIIMATTQADLLAGRGGAGIWRSTNGGNTWTQLFPASSSGPGSILRAMNAYGIAFAPNTSTVAIGMERGIAISTDNGTNWKVVKPNPTFTSHVYAVCMPDANKIIITSGAGVFYSHDGGQSWSAASGMNFWIGQGPARLDASPLNRNIVFFATDNFVSKVDLNNPNIITKYRQAFVSTDAGITWKEFEVPRRYELYRESFVKACRSTREPQTEFILYFGNGIDLYKKRIGQRGLDLDYGNSWQPINVNHYDPTDIAFNQEQTFPTVISGDGGILTYNQSSDTWVMTGGGSHGLHALQMTDIAGIYDTESRKPMWQFGTWDNYVWNSPDDGASWQHSPSGEGYYMQFEGRSQYQHQNFHSTHVSCYACSNVKTTGALQNQQYWYNPKGSEKGDPPWSLMRQGYYMQSVPRTETVSGVPVTKYEFHLTTDRGNTWKLKNEIPFYPVAKYHVADLPNGPMVYVPIIHNGKIGLMRIKQFTATPIVYRADGNGYNSMALHYVHGVYPVMGVNPRDPLHVIMADLETKQMKYTYDGGKCWFVDEALTRAVTENGNLLFHSHEFIQPTAIAFDPDHPRVVVGTRDAGLFESKDDGVTWSAIPNTKQISWISSLFYGFDNDLLVTSYGRGLWEIKLKNNNLKKGRHPYYPCHETFFDNTETGLQTVFEDPSDLPDSLDGKVIINPDGEIMDIVVNADGIIEHIAVDRGNLVTYDSLLQSHVVTHIMHAVAAERGSFDRIMHAQHLVREGKHIRGIVERDRKILGFIISDQPWPGFVGRMTDVVITEPYIYLLDTSFTNTNQFMPGTALILTGIKFDPAKPVSMYFKDSLITADVKVNEEGGFLFQWEIPYLVKGHYTLKVEQEADEQKIMREVVFFIGGD